MFEWLSNEQQVMHLSFEAQMTKGQAQAMDCVLDSVTYSSGVEGQLSELKEFALAKDPWLMEQFLEALKRVEVFPRHRVALSAAYVYYNAAPQLFTSMYGSPLPFAAAAGMHGAGMEAVVSNLRWNERLSNPDFEKQFRDKYQYTDTLTNNHTPGEIVDRAADIALTRYQRTQDTLVADPTGRTALSYMAAEYRDDPRLDSFSRHFREGISNGIRLYDVIYDMSEGIVPNHPGLGIIQP